MTRNTDALFRELKPDVERTFGEITVRPAEREVKAWP